MTITPLWTLNGCPTRWSLLLIYFNFSIQITETYSKVLLNPHHLPIISIHHTKCVTVQQNASSETITVQDASHTSSWSLQNPFSLFLHLGGIFYTILGFIRRSQVCEMAFRILRKEIQRWQVRHKRPCSLVSQQGQSRWLWTKCKSTGLLRGI